MGWLSDLFGNLGSEQRHIVDLARAEGDAARRGDESKAAKYARLRQQAEARVEKIQRDIDKWGGE